MNVFLIGDIHEGAANHDEEAFRAAVELIRRTKKEEPATYCVGMGDYTDCIIGQSDPRWDPIEVAEKYNIHDLKDLPRKQMEYFMRTIEPIRDTFVAYLTGNHEESYTRHHSFDVYGYLCGQNPDAHKLGYVGMLRFTVTLKGKPLGSVDFALNHGAGGGGFREGYPVNKCYDVFRNSLADVYAMGHIHKLAAEPDRIKSIDHTGFGLAWRKEWHCLTGCFLRSTVEGSRGYFEHKPGKESDIGMLRVRFRIRKRGHGGKRWVKEIEVEKIYLDEGARAVA